jgi:hypothetical protein
MKALLALSAGWIAFYLADQAIYNGHHAQRVGEFIGAVATGFAFR